MDIAFFHLANSLLFLLRSDNILRKDGLTNSLLVSSTNQQAVGIDIADRPNDVKREATLVFPSATASCGNSISVKAVRIEGVGRSGTTIPISVLLQPYTPLLKLRTYTQVCTAHHTLIARICHSCTRLSRTRDTSRQLPAPLKRRPRILGTSLLPCRSPSCSYNVRIDVVHDPVPDSGSTIFLFLTPGFRGKSAYAPLS